MVESIPFDDSKTREVFAVSTSDGDWFIQKNNLDGLIEVFVRIGHHTFHVYESPYPTDSPNIVEYNNLVIDVA